VLYGVCQLLTEWNVSAAGHGRGRGHRLQHAVNDLRGRVLVQGHDQRHDLGQDRAPSLQRKAEHLLVFSK